MININGFLNYNITPKDVFEFIKIKYDKKAKFCEGANSNKGGNILFYEKTNKNKKILRGLYYYIADENKEDEKYLKIALSYNKSSKNIITDILKKFGGYLEENKKRDIEYLFIPKEY